MDVILCSICTSLFVRPDQPPGTSGEPDRVTYSYESISQGIDKNCCICSLMPEMIRRQKVDFTADIEVSGILSWGSYMSKSPWPWRVIFLFDKGEKEDSLRVTKPIENSDSSEGCVEVDPAFSSTLSTPRRLLSDNTGDKASLNLAAQWLDICRTSHAQCQAKLPRNSYFAPTRLVFTGHDDNTDKVYLAVPSEEPNFPTPVEYITLSHRWRAEMPKLLKSNIELLKCGINVNELPRTFQDAITMTRRLKMQYLWIDCLCIVQDDTDDWRKECSQMGLVYESAVCNLAATEASVRSISSIGLFTQRNPLYVTPLRVQMIRKNYNRYNYIFPRHSQRDHYYTPLLSRGWVLQERALSPRTIYFGYQLGWECCSTKATESFPTGSPLSMLREGLYWYPLFKNSKINKLLRSTDKAELYDNWHYLILHYGRCGLSVESDTLPALSGLARRMAKALNDEYLAGVWRGDLIYSLLWQPMKPARSQWPSLFDETFYPREYRAPSWSWASVNIPIDYFREPYPTLREKMVPLVRIIDIVVNHATKDVYGPVRSGYIRFDGHLRKTKPYRGKLEYTKYHNTFDQRDKEDIPIKHGETYQFPLCCIPFPSPPLGLRPIELIGLILKPLGGSPATYQRVGVFYHPSSVRKDTWRATGDCLQHFFTEFEDFDPRNPTTETITII